MRHALVSLVAASLVAAGCWTANPLYCDDQTPCGDPALPRCDLVAHECRPADDAGALDAAVAADAGGAETVSPADASVQTDTGCAPGSHSCGGGCYPDTDPNHCGAACTVCGGKTPECAGGACVCTSTSCAGNEICSGGACQPNGCQNAGECTTPPDCRTAVGAVCNASGLCEYPTVAGDGASCSGSRHCCGGTCVANDAAHCGAGCAVCGGTTPACDGTACVCTLTSCAAGSPICDSTGACRGCATNAECQARDNERPVCHAPTCEPNVCGDRYVDPSKGERCDDGNHDNGDGCDPTCRYTGTVTTIAGKTWGSGYCDDTGVQARIKGPQHLAFAFGGGALFFSEDFGTYTVRRAAMPAFAVTTLAGDRAQHGTADGVGAAARFEDPAGVASDGTYIYVVDKNSYTIRRVTIADGTTVTIAGAAGQSGSADGNPGTSARFNFPKGLAHSGQKLYVTDACAIRVVDTSIGGNYAVTTLAGTTSSSGSLDGTGTAARFWSPHAITVSSGGDLYVADTYNHTVRKVTSAGVVTTPFGTAGALGSDDGVGAAARFNYPKGITFDAYGTVLFVSDSGNHTIRKLDPNSKSVSTLAGAVGQIGFADGQGATARFNSPFGLAATNLSPNDIYVADASNHLIRRVSTSGQVSTVIGAKGESSVIDGTGSNIGFAGPGPVALLSTGVIVQDGTAFRSFDLATVTANTICGSPTSSGFVDGAGLSARFMMPGAPVGFGSVSYIPDSSAVREYDPNTLNVVTRAGDGTAAVVDGDGSSARFKQLFSAASDGTFVYLSDWCTIRKFTAGAPWHVETIVGESSGCGAADGQGSAGRVSSLCQLLVVGTTLFVMDRENAALRAIDISNATGPYTITTVAGTLGVTGHVDGVGSSARFGGLRPPFGRGGAMAYDGESLFVADSSTIRQIDLTTMRVTTLAGRYRCGSAIDGSQSTAAFGGPNGIIYLPTERKLLVSDEHVLRLVE
jgi:hypothetical protein